MNAMQVGYTRHDFKDALCNRERVAAVERELSSDEFEAQMSVDGKTYSVTTKPRTRIQTEIQ